MERYNDRIMMFLMISLSFDLSFLTTQRYLTQAVANPEKIWRLRQTNMIPFLEKQ